VSEKTEQPTPKKIKEARQKGQSARSRMLGSAAATVGGLLAATNRAPAAAAELQGWAGRLFTHPELSPRAELLEGLHVARGFCAPVLGSAFACALGVSLTTAALQGLTFNVGLVAPKWERVSPSSGLKRLFSAKQLIELLKALVVVTVLTAVVASAVRAAGPGVLRSIGLDAGAALQPVLLKLSSTAVRGAFVLLALGMGDYLWARRQYLKELMMTREEKKEEHKNSEGNPHAKGKRKALHRQLLAGGRARGVQKATCIVVNPTHIAIALRYEAAEADAPYIVAKGRAEDALRIRKHAQELKIPIVKDIPLARSLIHYDVGDEIPEELYKAAAVVLKVALEANDADRRPGSRT
jgi:type III secretion protein U